FKELDWGFGLDYGAEFPGSMAGSTPMLTRGLSFSGEGSWTLTEGDRQVLVDTIRGGLLARGEVMEALQTYITETSPLLNPLSYDARLQVLDRALGELDQGTTMTRGRIQQGGQAPLNRQAIEAAQASGRLRPIEEIMAAPRGTGPASAMLPEEVPA